MYFYTHTHIYKHRGKYSLYSIKISSLVSLQTFSNISQHYNSLAEKVLLKIKVQSCATWFSLQRQKFQSSKILQVYLKHFIFWTLRSCDVRIDVWDLTKGKTQAFQSPAVSRCGPDSSKEAENTTESYEFSHYCSIQGALSSWSFHPLIQQKTFCPPICRHKRLCCPEKASVAHLASLRCSHSCSFLGIKAN